MKTEESSLWDEQTRFIREIEHSCVVVCMALITASRSCIYLPFVRPSIFLCIANAILTQSQMASFNIAKLIRQAFLLLLAFLILVFASPLEKRATQVSLINYTFQNNVLAGSISV
jgi:hypothetical protein